MSTPEKTQYQEPQLFSTIGIEIHQAIDSLPTPSDKLISHHLVTVDHDSTRHLVLHSDTTGSTRSYVKYDEYGDIVKVHEEVASHSGVEIPFRSGEGFIARKNGADSFNDRVKGFWLDCLGDDPEYAYIACNYGDIVQTTALIPIEDIVSIELRPEVERDYVARYHYELDLSSIYRIPILEKDGVTVASRDFTWQDTETVRSALADLEGHEIYRRR